MAESKNEAVAVGGRPGVGAIYDNLTSFGVPLADEHMRQPTPTARNPRPVTVPPNPLPRVFEARNLLGKEIERLRRQAEGLERSIAAHPAAFAGNGNPYMASVVQAHNAMTAGYRQQLAAVKDELKKLESLDDHGAQEWARDYMATHKGGIRG